MTNTHNNFSNIAVISDTHGLLRPALFNQLIGVDLIIHAGDICDDAILEQLQYVAPVQAVRGNMDRSGACGELPSTTTFQLGKYKVYLIHDINRMEPAVLTDGTNLIIHGHTHLPSYEFSDHVTYLNPGSCGPHRPEKPICFCKIDLSGNEPKPKFINLEL